MQATQNDLSYNHTKLDYQALLKTSISAFAHTRNEAERLLHQTHEIGRTDFSLICRWLADEARQLEVIAETMHTLQEGLTRQDLEIINKPEVKEK